MNEEKHWTFAPQTPAIGDVQALLFQMPCWACDGRARAPGSGCVEGGPYVNIILLFDPPLCARPESCSTLLPGALPSQPHAPPLTIIKERALFGKGGPLHPRTGGSGSFIMDILYTSSPRPLYLSSTFSESNSAQHSISNP